MKFDFKFRNLSFNAPNSERYSVCTITKAIKCETINEQGNTIAISYATASNTKQYSSEQDLATAIQKSIDQRLSTID